MNSIKILIYLSFGTLVFLGASRAFAARYYFSQPFTNNITITGFFDGEDTIDAAGNPIPDGHIDQREVSFIEYIGTGHPVLNQRGWNPNHYANVQHILDYNLTENSFTYDSSGFDGNKNPTYANGQYISPGDSSVIDFSGFYYYHFHFTSSSVVAGKLWGINSCLQNGFESPCPPEVPGFYSEKIVEANALEPAIVSTTPAVPIPSALLLFSSGLLSLVLARKKR